MEKDFKVTAPQLYHCSTQHVLVLEGPSAETNAAQANGDSNAGTYLDDGCGQRIVEARGDLRDGATSGQGFDDADDGGAKVNDQDVAWGLASVQVEGIAAGYFRRGGRFERDGCLAFKRNLRGQAEQRGYRVEEAACGRGVDRLDALREHRVNQLEVLWRDRLETPQGWEAL